MVDNGSHDETWDLAHLCDVAVRNHRNEGFARACNEGAFVASGDVFVFLNNDTEPEPGWLEALLEPFTVDYVGVTGARLLYPDGRIQHAGVTLYFEHGVLTAANLTSDHDSRDVPAVTGACLAIRREAFEQVGGFDEGYWNGYEDVDLCLTVRKAGWQVRYVPEAVVVHHESASGPERWTGVRQNVQRLQDKWAVSRTDVRSA